MKNKIVVVYKDLEGNIAEETLWANLLESGNYEVDNIPFYAPNLAYQDIVSVEKDEDVLYFDDLVEPSGHSTLQIIFFDKDRSIDILKRLEELGCSWEGMDNEVYFAVDVPPDISYNNVQNLLNEKGESGTLDYKEACLSKGHKL